MQYEEVIYQVSEGIATVTLNRPEKLNAWTLQMGREVEHAISTAAVDETVKVIILTGAGRAFCAGADLSLVQAISQADDAQRANGGAAPFNLYLPALKKPIIAAVNGHAVGMGLALALACDIRYASSGAKFATTFSKLGLIAEWGMAWTLPRLVGLSKALDLLYSSRTFDAGEALSLGVVDKVFSNELLMEQTNGYAEQLAKTISPRSLGVIRAQIYLALEQTLEQAADTAQAEMLAGLASEDCKEGVAAFLEKRAPVFTGR